MDTEPELKAMGDVYSVLKNLEDEGRQRVIDWIIGKFALSSTSQKKRGGLPKTEGNAREEENRDFDCFDSVADVYANASVKTDSDKVLVLASYLQLKKGGEDLTGREINKELTHLGHGVSNITSTISALMNRKPQLMIQTRKEGKSQQAQKKYKVTNEGLIEARKMINPSKDE